MKIDMTLIMLVCAGLLIAGFSLALFSTPRMERYKITFNKTSPERRRKDDMKMRSVAIAADLAVIGITLFVTHCTSIELH